MHVLLYIQFREFRITTMKLNYFFLFLSVCMISCNEDIPCAKQDILFEKHYVNSAWIPQSSGFLIDYMGNVLEFKWVEVLHIWFDPDSTGNISSWNMEKNISYCQIINYKINMDTLKYYVNKICAASNGIISEPQHVFADAGTTTYSAFIFNERTNQYKQVLLKKDGDISITNSAPGADEIYHWLTRIGQN